MTLADEVLELRIDARSAPPRVFLFVIRLRGEDVEVGEISLRLDRDDAALAGYAGHIGYEIKPAHRGRRLALRACRLLAPLARAHGFAALWITVAPDNAASCRTLDLLGARYVDTVDVPRTSDMFVLGLRRMRRYRWDLPEGTDASA